MPRCHRHQQQEQQQQSGCYPSPLSHKNNDNDNNKMEQSPRTFLHSNSPSNQCCDPQENTSTQTTIPRRRTTHHHCTLQPSILIMLLLLSFVEDCHAQFCTTKLPVPTSWADFERAISSSDKNHAVFCPFTISGKGNCPSQPYRVSTPNTFILCEPSFVGNEIKGCVIDCPNVHFEVMQNASLVLDSMTLRGATQSAVKVKPGASLRAISCVMENNKSNSGNGGAIDAASTSKLKIVNTRFQNNMALNGGAIYHLGLANITKSQFADNEASNGGGGAIFSGSDSTLEIRESIFAANEAQFFGPSVFDGSAKAVNEENLGCDNVLIGKSVGCDGISSIVNQVSMCSAFQEECISPTASPTAPTAAPSGTPTWTPSIMPSQLPSATPSLRPSALPSTAPSDSPTFAPSVGVPSGVPSMNPSSHSQPSEEPTQEPSLTPSFSPTGNMPSASPTLRPSVSPSSHPTEIPSMMPSLLETRTARAAATSQPTNRLFFSFLFQSSRGANQPGGGRRQLSTASTTQDINKTKFLRKQAR